MHKAHSEMLEKDAAGLPVEINCWRCVRRKAHLGMAWLGMELKYSMMSSVLREFNGVGPVPEG